MTIKKTSKIIIALVIVMATIDTAEANHNNGVVIGAGSGAIIGHAIAGDVTGTAIGSVIGRTMERLIIIGSPVNHKIVVGPRPAQIHKKKWRKHQAKLHHVRHSMHDRWNHHRI